MTDTNQKLREALSELMSIVSIHQKATGNNFAWAEMDFAREALAATPAPAPAQEVDEAQIQKLRENGAKAWAGVDAQQLRAGFAATSQEPANRPQNCGTNYCSCIECVCEPSQEPVTLTDEEIDRVVLEAVGFEGYGCQAMNKADMRGVSRAIISAIRAKGGK